MNIPNLKPIREKLAFTTNTNILDIKDDFESISEKVLTSFEFTDFGIDVFRKEIKRDVNPDTGRKESKEKWFRRVHQLVGQEITKLGNKNSEAKVKYELFRLPKEDAFLVFFISPSIKIDQESVEDTLDYLDEVAEKLDDRDKRKLTQSLLSLVVKAAVYESCKVSKTVCSEFANSELLLSPIVETKKKTYVSALRPSFFLSEQNEFIIELSSTSYELNPEQNVGVEIETDTVNAFMMHNDVKHRFTKKVRATQTKRDFYLTKDQFGQSKLLAYAYINDIMQKKFADIGIKFSARKFSPTHEVDSFARIDYDKSTSLAPIYLVDTKNAISESIEGYSRFVEKLSEWFGAVGVLDAQQYYQQLGKLSEPCIYIFVNGSQDSDGTIEYFNDDLKQKLKGEKESEYPSFNTTFQAFERLIKDKHSGEESSFDVYTSVKISLLERSLSGLPTKDCYQGYNVTKKAVKALLAMDDYYRRVEEGELFSDGEVKKIFKELNSTDAKIQKIKTELLLKQMVFFGSKLALVSNGGVFPKDGDYLVDFFKHTKEQGNDEYYHSKLKISVVGGVFEVVDKKVRRHIRELVDEESPYLKTVKKIFNDSYFIHSLETKETLTSYNSIRTPLTLENELLHLPSEWEKTANEPDKLKMFGKANGVKNKEECILPFYINSSRGNKDALTEGSKSYHYLIMEPKDNECLLFVSDAGAPNQKIHKQTLCKNIICWDENGKPRNWDESSLFGFYLACHTYNVVKLSETAKTALITKLAAIALIN
ncbi:hypothetical protein QTV49_001798 [Vibrio vulnificus]|nr:hypothetical protein [Vibrio vulnificus]